MARRIRLYDQAPRCCRLEFDPGEDERFVRACKALGHPARLALLKHVSTHAGCITGELAAEIGLAQATVSQHLKVLRDSGWLQGEIEGPATCYQIRPETAAWFKALVHTLFSEPEETRCPNCLP